jgi:hypothetical protein
VLELIKHHKAVPQLRRANTQLPTLADIIAVHVGFVASEEGSGPIFSETCGLLTQFSSKQLLLTHYDAI